MAGRNTLLLLLPLVTALVAMGTHPAQGAPTPSQTTAPLHLLGVLSRPAASEADLQRVGGSVRRQRDYSDAVYAGKFAQQLQQLELAKKNVYVSFITSGFMEAEVPRVLPSDLQVLSRTEAGPLGASPSPAIAPRPSRRPAPSPPTLAHSSVSSTTSTRFFPKTRGRLPSTAATPARGVPTSPFLPSRVHGGRRGSFAFTRGSLTRLP